MCVIMAFEDKYPTKEILESAETTNKDGGGIAWIDDGKVKWEKGLHVKSQYIQDLIAKEKIQLPIIIHFRIATHGGVNDSLCHPFAISSQNTEDLELAGDDKEGVMFHNGILSKWEDVAMQVLIKHNDVKMPDGGLSDSRIMAWCIRFFGINYLSLIDEKVLVLTPKGVQRFGKGWGTVDKVTCSNTHFDKPKHTGYTYMNGSGYTSVYDLDSDRTSYTKSEESKKDFQGSVVLKEKDGTKKKGKGKGKKGKSKRNMESLKEGETIAIGSQEEYEEEYKMLLEAQIVKKQSELARLQKSMKTSELDDTSEDLGTGWFDEVGQWHSSYDPDYWQDDYLY